MAELLRRDSDRLPRRLGATAPRPAQWREALLAGGRAALESRAPGAGDAEILQLRATIGEIAKADEFIPARCHAPEAGPPLARRARSA